jgi:2-furoyl-CoA dehydrogenase large subunit
LTAPNEQDEVNSSLCHGFIFDFCGVEIDRTTGNVRIDRYVTMHDCGRILHPAMMAGQVTGGFAHALGAALFEEYAYGQDGSFLAGSFADYLVPTIMEVPEPIILHHETRSPFTPLGAKGVGEGNCMSTPVCIANAVADALGVADIELPLVPSRIAEHLHGTETPPKHAPAQAAQKAGARHLFGEGSATVRAPRQAVWDMLLDANTLEKVVPGAHGIERVSDTHFRADVTLGVGPVKGRYKAEIRLTDLAPPQSLTLSGEASGALGFGGGRGFVTLEETNATTTIRYRYEAGIGGKVASVGGRLLDGAARFLIGQFFAALAKQTSGDATGPAASGFFARLFGRLRGRA